MGVLSKRPRQQKGWSFQEITPEAASWPHLCLAGIVSQIGFEPSHALKLLFQQLAPCQTLWDLADWSAPTSTEIKSHLPRGSDSCGLVEDAGWVRLRADGLTRRCQLQPPPDCSASHTSCQQKAAGHVAELTASPKTLAAGLVSPIHLAWSSGLFPPGTRSRLIKLQSL